VIYYNPTTKEVTYGSAPSLGNFAFSGDTLLNTLSNAITLQVGGNNYIFGSSGQITFPNATVQTTAYTGLTTNGTKTSTATGTAGQTSFDSNYFYICIATNTWRRVALGSTY
jgi:hypothetical protein